MFGHEAKPCKVFEFGCLNPTAGEDIFTAEIRRRNQFWNRLVEVDRAYRAKVSELLDNPDNPIPKILKELEEVRNQIKKARKSERSGKVDTKDLNEKARILREQLAVAKLEQKEKRKKTAQFKKEQLDALDKERKEAVKQAQHESGLYWCNYDEVLKNYDEARRRAMKSKAELKFHRFDGTGKVTIRYQKGLPVKEAFGNNTLLQIKPVPEEAWYHPVRGMRRKLSRTTIRLRVTSENKKPVWIELPMVMHRPLPPNSEIRSASVIRERVGRNWRYKVTITTTVEPVKNSNNKGVVAIDLGWRQIDSGLRVAYWVDDNGNNGELVLSHRDLHGFRKCDDLRSIRDQYLNEIKNALSKWNTNNDSPDWLKEELKNLSAWRSSGRLIALSNKWRENRFEGDAEIFDALEYWRSRDNHLYDWEANLRDQVHRRRREIYRIFAAEIAKKYSNVVMEDFNLQQIAKKPEAEEGTKGALPVDRQRFIASVSQLRLAIENTDIEVKTVETKFSTLECSQCGHIEKFDATKQIWRTCPKCHELWDQDYNAANNLLKRYFANTEAFCAEK